MEEQEIEIPDMYLLEYHSANRVIQLVNYGRLLRFAPFSIVLATVLYCAEFVSAAMLSNINRKTEDDIGTGFTITFMLVPAVLTQLALTFIHRDVGQDRPLVLLLHLLLLGPVIRCFEALIVYFNAVNKEEAYVTLSRKIILKKGRKILVEWETGRSERTLAAHRNAFKRMAVIQAFLGSVPQLTLQMYATIQEKYIMPARLVLMIINLVSITYGALVCSVLAIHIRYDDYKVRIRPAAYLCMTAWRGLEIATRVTVLVLFSTALTHWVILVGMANLLFFFFLPWAEFWAKKGSLTQGVERNFSNFGTVVVLTLFTLLYACINVFCWSAVQLDFTHRELIQRKQGWGRLALYYCGRFVENLVLITLWYFYKSDFYEKVCTPLLVVQLLICYSLSVLFMLLFYQFCHPCRSLFKHNVHDCLRCICCQKGTSTRQNQKPSYSHLSESTAIVEDLATAAV
uniref:XK-related protein n=1 Tax=Takifugu rubripes TaxID=31033 RepID=H2U318_TAKRU